MTTQEDILDMFEDARHNIDTAMLYNDDGEVSGMEAVSILNSEITSSLEGRVEYLQWLEKIGTKAPEWEVKEVTQLLLQMEKDAIQAETHQEETDNRDLVTKPIWTGYVRDQVDEDYRVERFLEIQDACIPILDEETEKRHALYEKASDITRRIEIVKRSLHAWAQENELQSTPVVQTNGYIQFPNEWKEWPFFMDMMGMFGKASKAWDTFKAQRDKVRDMWTKYNAKKAELIPSYLWPSVYAWDKEENDRQQGHKYFITYEQAELFAQVESTKERLDAEVASEKHERDRANEEESYGAGFWSYGEAFKTERQPVIVTDMRDNDQYWNMLLSEEIPEEQFSPIDEDEFQSIDMSW